MNSTIMSNMFNAEMRKVEINLIADSEEELRTVYGKTGAEIVPHLKNAVKEVMLTALRDSHMSRAVMTNMVVGLVLEALGEAPWL